MNPANPNQDKTLARIDALKRKLIGTDRPDHIEIVSEWEKKAKKSLLLLDLKKHQGVKILADMCVEQIKEANELLNISKSDSLSSSERDSLIEKRNVLLWLLRLFGQARDDLNQVSEDVDKEFENEEEEML